MPKGECIGKCKASDVKKAENALRDIKNWVSVFAKEYDLPKEAVDTLNKKIEELARDIGDIC